ncbi:MAG: hypothetical protein CM15mP106_3760 [Candidatus Neomarinimicrobiota bacterium]|nr:MAG: hypothetical protein CM15mP106_3760 [Candidatus Neomarinimicrobiota bacterium]
MQFTQLFLSLSSDSLRDRINDSECKILVTQDTGVRGNKQNIPMKENADRAVEKRLHTAGSRCKKEQVKKYHGF